jgi:hypothetical protein
MIYLFNYTEYYYLPCNFEVNYTLYKNAGFWLVNSRDIFLQIQAFHCEFAEFLIWSIFSNSGHVGWCTASPDTIWKLDTLVMIQTKFGEDFWKSLTYDVFRIICGFNFIPWERVIFFYMGLFSWKGRAALEKNWKTYNRLADELFHSVIMFVVKHKTNKTSFLNFK